MSVPSSTLSEAINCLLRLAFEVWIIDMQIGLVDVLSLGTRKIYLPFSSKNIAVEAGDPLAAPGRHIEIADPQLDLGLHVFKIKLRKFINDVFARRIAWGLVQSDLLKLVEQ